MENPVYAEINELIVEAGKDIESGLFNSEGFNGTADILLKKAQAMALLDIARSLDGILLELSAYRSQENHQVFTEGCLDRLGDHLTREINGENGNG